MMRWHAPFPLNTWQVFGGWEVELPGSCLESMPGVPSKKPVVKWGAFAYQYRQAHRLVRGNLYFAHNNA
jgi:hypothetical protein